MDANLIEQKINTGIPALDVILEGGFVPGSLYIVQGNPGSGKTILANQACLEFSRKGKQSIYPTLLSESQYS